jgi:hypothetical protein
VTRADKITLGITVATFAAWLWLDAFLTILERTGGV